MATYVNGFGGSITFGASPATLAVESWSLNINAEALDTTNTADSGWESNILGAKSWDGSLKTFWDSSAVPTGTAGFLPGTRATITLPVSGTGKDYTGTCQLTKVGTENAAKGVVTFTVDFKGTGALTYPT